MGFWRRVCVLGVAVPWIVVVMGVGRLVFGLDHRLLVFEEKGVWVRYLGPDPRLRRKVTRRLSLKVRGLIGPGAALQRGFHSWTFSLHLCHMMQHQAAARGIKDNQR